MRYRQSSLIADAAVPPMGLDGCMHKLANLSALSTPDHFADGCGTRQRNSPVGGAAKGMPRYTVMPSSLFPSTKPLSVGLGAVALVVIAGLLHPASTGVLEEDART